MKNINKQVICFFLFFFGVEVLFRFQSNTLGWDVLIFRSGVFSFFVSGIFVLINGLTRSKGITIVTLLYSFFVSFYAFIQIALKGYYEAFFSFRFLTQDVPNVQSYVSDFIYSFKPFYFTYLILFLVFGYFYLNLRKKQYVFKEYKVKLLFAFISLFSFLVFLLSSLLDPVVYLENSFQLFKNPYYTESAYNQLGLLPVMHSDFQYVIFPSRGVAKIEYIDDGPPIELPKEPEVDSMIRIIDDSHWIEVMSAEENADYRKIDQYFLNQKITPRNDQTGLFEGKNLIYVLIEAFDELAIHPDITPTLFRLKTEGMYFNQFHSPQFNCATAESELMSVSGLLPVIGSCTMANYYSNTTNQTLYKLFKQQGYETRSFHNWNDQFYPRTKIHPRLGSDIYKDESVTIPSRVTGWQSDLTMMNTVVKDLNDVSKNHPFMSYVITSTTHFPYDKPSYLGDAHASLVRQYMPNAPEDIVRYLSKAVELDLSIKYLMDNLESMEDTVLVLFSDHRPFKIPSHVVVDHADNTNKGNHYDSTPMIIYTPGVNPEINSKVSSTLDLSPTIANLFNLNYDPRLYMGNDIYSSENNTVIMQSGSWRDQVGKYDSSKAVFEPYNSNQPYTDSDIEAKNAMVRQKLAISSSVYLEGYFNARLFLGPQ